MEIQYSQSHELTPEEQQHLAKLKACVEQAVADGKLSLIDENRIRQLIREDGKVTVEELRTIKDTIREVLGDATLEFDWQ